MPKKRVVFKDVVVGFRVTPQIKHIAVQVAMSEGLDLSEWLRGLLIKELKSRGVLPRIQEPPTV